MILEQERERVQEVLDDLMAYCDSKGIARKKKGGADEIPKKKVNSLIVHQCMRDEITQYLNKFSMIEVYQPPAKKKNK